MARIRTIKPEISLHEGLFELEAETGLPIRFAWAVLPCHCDREGRFKWRPRPLGAQILPYDGVDFSRVLDALLTRGFLIKYRVGDAWFGSVPTFLKHQVVNNRESASELPGQEEADEVFTPKGPGIFLEEQELTDAIPTRGPRVDDATPTPLVQDQEEGKGREGKGKEGKDNTSSDTRVVFDHWRSVMGHDKAKLDAKRKRLITSALKLGYSVEDLQQTITGYSQSPFHMGENDNGRRYDGLELLLRNADKIDAGIEFYRNPPRLRGAQSRVEAINRQAVDDFSRGEDPFGFGEDDETIIDVQAARAGG